MYNYLKSLNADVKVIIETKQEYYAGLFQVVKHA